MPPALISPQHWAWTLHQLAFFRPPLGRNVTHGRFSIGDALAAAHLITPMGRISWISKWFSSCSSWAINKPLNGHWVFAFCSELHLLKTSVDNCHRCRRGLTSSQTCAQHVLFNFIKISPVTHCTCCISKITLFSWIIYFSTLFSDALFHADNNECLSYKDK